MKKIVGTQFTKHIDISQTKLSRFTIRCYRRCYLDAIYLAVLFVIYKDIRLNIHLKSWNNEKIIIFLS